MADASPTGTADSGPGRLALRAALDADIAIFFAHQNDAVAAHMAAFTGANSSDLPAFRLRWRRLLADETVIIRTITVNGIVAGHVLSYEADEKPEVSYWIGREFWGQGVATGALTLFLRTVNRTRPIYARAAADNAASLRVLQKCGFALLGRERGFANARQAEIDELLLVLTA